MNDKPLVVVESPTKVRTINKYLGKDYNVAATVGHIKDLPPKEMGIEIEDNFKPKYRTIPENRKSSAHLKRPPVIAAIFIWPPTLTGREKPLHGMPKMFSRKRGAGFIGYCFTN